MKNHAALLVGVVVSFLLAEGALRVLQPMPLAGVQIAGCEGLQPDATTGYRYAAHSSPYHERYFEYALHYDINNLGFYDADRASRHDGLRIVAVGDSFTAALQVPQQATWTAVAERALRETDLPGAGNIEVLNGGLSGTGIQVHLALIEQLATEVSPDVVALMYLWNDLEDSEYALQYQSCYKDFRIVYQDEETRKKIEDFIDTRYDHPVVNWLIRNTMVLRALNYHYRVTPIINVVHHGDVSVPWKKVDRTNYLDTAMSQFAALAEKYDFIPVVVPPPGKPDADGAMISGMDDIASIAKTHGIQSIDLRVKLEQRMHRAGKEASDLFFVLDGHYGQLGNEYFGIEFAEAMRELLASSRPDEE